MLKEYIHKEYLKRRYDKENRGDDWWKARGYYPINRDKNYSEPAWNEEVFWNDPDKWEFGTKYANVTFYYQKITPSLVIVSSSSSDPDNTVFDTAGEVTCPVGTTLTFNVELHIRGQKIEGINQHYRTPIRARDGREKIIAIDIVDGAATVKVTMRESGCWEVTGEMINENLGDDEKMNFSGIRAFVVDVPDVEEV